MYYKNDDGDTVFTSDYYRKRGSCCKSNCLHCPFGTTLKNIGIKLLKFDTNDETNTIIQNLITKLDANSEFTSSMLADAFGKSKSYKIADSYLMTLKGVNCGILYFREGKIEKILLRPEFSNQGIEESYLMTLL